jgi:hypothetical protein
MQYRGNWLEEAKRDFLGWILKLGIAAEEVPLHNTTLLVRSAVEQLLEPTPGEGTFLVEVLSTPEDLNTTHGPKLRVAVAGNSLKMLATDQLLYIELGPEIYGLAIANKGSYLIQGISDSSGTTRSPAAETEKGH